MLTWKYFIVIFIFLLAVAVLCSQSAASLRHQQDRPGDVVQVEPPADEMISKSFLSFSLKSLRSCIFYPSLHRRSEQAMYMQVQSVPGLEDATQITNVLLS